MTYVIQRMRIIDITAIISVINAGLKNVILINPLI